jgi:hypothetical protein
MPKIRHLFRNKTQASDPSSGINVCEFTKSIFLDPLLLWIDKLKLPDACREPYRFRLASELKSALQQRQSGSILCNEFGWGKNPTWPSVGRVSMKNQPQSVEQPRFLSGWKEIANYLGKGVRTVQRYERALGLPVRRPAGNATGSVVATKPELDAWVAASPIREAFRLTKTESGAGSRTTKSIMTGIEEMTRLREQMMALRSDMRMSVQALCESLYSL